MSSVTLDALQVHLNGELALADLDDAIPLDLADLQANAIKEEAKETLAKEAPKPEVKPDPATEVKVEQKPEPTPAPKPTIAPPAAVNPERRARASPTSGRVDKPKISCTLKEKREREARQFPRALLSNLDGTTSAEVRKMTSEERELVLYKRKLRNRESARRSRQKRQATLADLHDEIGELTNVAKRMVDLGASLHATNVGLRDKLDLAHAEIRALRAAYDHPHPKNKAGA